MKGKILFGILVLGGAFAAACASDSGGGAQGTGGNTSTAG
jgi:hypothetical protein